jgi:hypothetical protein
MLQLSGSTQKLQVTPGTTGGDLDVTATYTDRSGTTDTPDSQETTAIGGTTAVDILNAPGGSDKRRVRWLSLRNTSATVTSSYLITKQNSTGPVTTEVFKTTLAPGEELLLSGNGVWFVYDVNGAVKASNQPGRFLRTRRFTSGTSFVVSSDCNMIRVIVIGGGGGGGGCSSVAAAAAAAGGGGSGARADKIWAVTPGATINYTIGAGGVGNSGAAGSNGGNTTITGPDAVVVTAPGGLGAPLATALTTLSTKLGGDGGGVATNGDFNKGGNPGAPGIIAIVSGPNGVSGNGGSGLYGDGGIGIAAVGNGVAGGGNGGGGSGGLTGASVARTGGAGSSGIIVVEEYS